VAPRQVQRERRPPYRLALSVGVAHFAAGVNDLEVSSHRGRRGHVSKEANVDERRRTHRSHLTAVRSVCHRALAAT
jgi:hypothetical protein